MTARPVALLAGFMLLAAPLAAEAQQAGRIFRLGMLAQAAPDPSDQRTSAFLIPAALRELGYLEGQNLVIERRYAEGKTDRLPGLARDLVQLRVDVIVTVGPAAIRAAKDATTTIPIVFFGNFDPVAAGFVASLARPGGNATGVLIAPEGTLAGKKLELLKEMVPRATRIALLAPDDPNFGRQGKEVQKAALSLGVKLASVATLTQREKIIDLAIKNRLPAIYFTGDWVEAGGLLAYGASFNDLFRRAATYVDRILKGAKPGDLPVEQPTKFELVINLKTAKSLGLTIPRSLLLRADQVIE